MIQTMRRAVVLRHHSLGRHRPAPGGADCPSGPCGTDGKRPDGVRGHHWRLLPHQLRRRPVTLVRGAPRGQRSTEVAVTPSAPSPRPRSLTPEPPEQLRRLRSGRDPRAGQLHVEDIAPSTPSAWTQSLGGVTFSSSAVSKRPYQLKLSAGRDVLGMGSGRPGSFWPTMVTLRSSGTRWPRTWPLSTACPTPQMSIRRPSSSTAVSTSATAHREGPGGWATRPAQGPGAVLVEMDNNYCDTEPSGGVLRRGTASTCSATPTTVTSPTRRCPVAASPCPLTCRPAGMPPRPR